MPNGSAGVATELVRLANTWRLPGETTGDVRGDVEVDGG